MTDQWELGQNGEELAADYLSKNGFQILHHNWNLHRGCEIDLIARKTGELHFVEVKTRRSDEFSNPEEAVNAKKMQHIQAAISYFVSYYHIDPDTPLHMDVIGIVYHSENEYKLNFMPDVHYFNFSRSSYRGRQKGWRFR